MTVVFLLAFAGRADAQVLTVVQKAICFSIEPRMDDDASGVDDAVVEGVAEPARGAAARVVDVSDPAAPLLIYEGYTADSGIDPGCTPELALDTTHTYRVTARTVGRVNGHDLAVMASPGSPTPYAWVVPAFAPTIYPGDAYLTVGVGRRWQAYLVASHALWRNDGGLDALDLKMYLAECPYLASGGTCFDRGTAAVYLGGEEEGAFRKYRVSHEMGHYVAWMAIGQPPVPTHDYGADPGTCVTDPLNAHEAVSKEYQAAAIWEGYAHFYAAVVYNDAEDGDCGFVYYKQVDWDNNENVEADEENVPATGASCVGPPLPGDPPADFLGAECDGLLVNRATEWDWLRFLWYGHMAHGLSVAGALQVLEASDPATWWGLGPLAPELPYPTGDLPAYRMSASALDLGWSWWPLEAEVHGTWR